MGLYYYPQVGEACENSLIEQVIKVAEELDELYAEAAEEQVDWIRLAGELHDVAQALDGVFRKVPERVLGKAYAECISKNSRRGYYACFGEEEE